MMTVIRFVVYRALMSLARLFIDRQVKQYAGVIFGELDPVLPALMAAGKPIRAQVAVVDAIRAATGAKSVDPRQVAQVLDLFNPVLAAGRVGR
jgi:hypothetical protein